MLLIYCFLSDFVSGGELFTHLYNREHFTEDEARFYIAEVALALDHLHQVQIVLKKICISYDMSHDIRHSLYLAFMETIHRHYRQLLCYN